MSDVVLKAAEGVITRTPDRPSFRAYHFVSWADACAVLNVDDFSNLALVTDLSQGAWRGHWIISELKRQLGLEYAPKVQPMLDSANYADVVGQLIDNESMGDRNFFYILKSCQEIKNRVLEDSIQFIIVIPPVVGHVWEDENLQMMKMMFEAFRGTDVRVVLFCVPESNIPEDWEVVSINKPLISKAANYDILCYPGIAPVVVVEKLGVREGDYVILRSQCVAISPLLTRTVEMEQGSFNDCFRDTYLRVSCFSGRYNLVTREEVQREAYQRFSEGGYGIAIRLLQRLLLASDGIYEHALITSQIQNIRIALLRFEDAGAEAPPDDLLPDILKASLYQSKAWGLVMNNKADEAESYFEKARVFLNRADYPRLYLYLLNISALNRLRIGDSSGALQYEKQIEAALDEQPVRDWHIAYINNINQARLYKKAKDYERSERYYRKAFDVNEMLKTESDLMYENFCFSQLEQLKGDYPKAFLLLLRTCIHWLSNDMPEALAPRVAQAILNKKLGAERGDVEEISKQLRDGLLHLCSKMNFRLDEDNDVIEFCRMHQAETTPLVVVGVPGWSICLSDVSISPVFKGDQYDHLKLLTARIVRTHFPAVDWLRYRTIITDTQFSCELAANPPEVLLTARRLGIRQIIWGARQVVFTEKQLEDIDLRIKVGISAAVDFVTYELGRMKVYFRRYKSPILLTHAETIVMHKLHESGPCWFQEFGDGNLLRTLEERRVVRLYYAQ